MLNDVRLPLISFTGSTAVGRRVAQVVAGRFGRTILELGGNNAIVVTEGAKLDLAVRAILFGAVGTAGQRCTSTRRIIAHRSTAGPLVDRLKAAYTQVRIGNPLDAGVLMGPLVVPEAVDEMFKAIDQARAEGGTVVCGGKRRPDLGANFVEPTIIRMPAQTPSRDARDVRADPLRPRIRFASTTAIRLHNDVPQGLSSAIFTESMRQAEQFLSARRIGLRDRQREHRHVGRRNRRRVRRRKGNRRRARVRIRRLESLHAAADQHGQLERRAAARARD